MALLLVDGVLIALALADRTPDSGAAPQAEIVDVEVGADPSAEPSETPEPEGPAAPPATVTPQRVLTAIDDSTAWRVATGPCPEASVLPELTRDAGATWTEFDATAETGLRSVQRVIVSSADSIALVGLGAADCVPSLVRTYVGGQEWTDYPAEVASAWYVADGGATVHAPGGVVQPACTSGVAAVSVSGTAAAAALCTDGSIAATIDGGLTWGASTALPGVQALAPQPDGYLAAVLGSDGCAGVAIMTLDRAGAAPTPIGCRETAADPAALAGQIALSETGAGTLWLWAGDELLRSADRGAGWL